MGFGLLSIFLPLYIINEINGSLFQIGIMSAAALFLAIPASFFWGYMCDKTRRYKRYILISFLASTAFLYLFTLTGDVNMLIILYSAMSILHVAHEAPKNVLIAELYSRQDWERAFSFYEGFTETGWLIGLLLGFFMSIYGFGPVTTLLVCAGLNIVAFVLSLVLVADPLLVFERGLVGLERAIDFTSRGVFLASRLMDGMSVNEKLKKENVGLFCGGLVLFSLATSILFTPMPIFVSTIVGNAGLPAGLVFAIFTLSSAGAVGGYSLAGNMSTRSTGKTSVSKIVMSRSLLAFLLIVGLGIPSYNVMLVTAILVLLGFASAMFLVCTLSLSMELIPAGRAGMYNALIGVGAAFGAFIGPFVAQNFGFLHVFAVAGAIFFLAYIVFKFFA